ncbi:MAG: cell division protein FtsQ/DivIB [Paracoccaceae bacterium]|nr:cell division protein FtsQ/DivIB [Paracoccaceae bacterium]
MRPVRRHDPAPSRLAYRMHRMWLTPAFWWCLRFGLPMAAVTLLAVWTFATEDRRMAIYAWGQDIKRQLEERPEFVVTLLAVDGASDPVAREIRESLPVHLPVSSFDLDLEALRDVVRDVPAVATAEVHVRAGGVLEVAVTERVPVALWRGPAGLSVLSQDGTVIGRLARRAERADLPLLVGAGAERAVPEAFEVLTAAAPFAARIRGLQRVGERRWDIVLDRGQTVQLPAHEPVLAVERLIALDTAQDLLKRDVSVIDFRNRDRATVRLTDEAVTALRAIRMIETGGSVE